jgi:anti-sigma B factor antagonist
VSDNIESTNSNKPAFEYKLVEKQAHNVLVLSGDIDMHTAYQFKEAVMCILDGDEQHLIIDMNDVSYVDSSGLGIFVSAMKRVIPIGGTVNLVGCNPRINHMFYTTHLSSFIALHENMDDALTAISD